MLPMRWVMGLTGMPLMLALFCLAGCYSEKTVVRDGWAELRQMADKPSTQAQAGDSAAASPYRGYAILLASYRGQDRLAQAQLQAARLMQELKMSDIWIRPMESSVHLLRGHYPMPDVDRANQDLLTSRELVLDANRPFGQARIISLATLSDERESAAWDIKPFSGSYSLQVGFYDEEFGKDFRQAAEKAVAALREDGEQAYVYHGVYRSLVCVGLFRESDFGIDLNGTQTYGPKMLQVQKRYPYNLGNGLTIVQKIDGQSLTLPSFIIKIP